MVIGGVVLVVNISGFKFGELVLDGKMLGDIYFGKIKKWDDEVIIKLNSGVKLFFQNIVVVCCVDGFGIFFVFISYLVKVNDEWKLKVGVGFIVNWLIGLGGKGNDGIVVFVQCLSGVIGYVEYVYVKQNNLVYIKLVFVDGKLVSLMEDSFFNVVKGVDWSKIFVQDLINQKGDDVWLIIFIIFILVYKVQKKFEQGVEVLKFFDWVYKNGVKQVNDLDYVSLLDNVVEQVCIVWKISIKDSNGKVLY